MYRGKRKDTGEWVYGWYGHKEATDQHFIMIERLHDAPDYGSYFVDVEVDPETVGQSTGLHDRNEREIYEGDIIQHIPSKGKGRVFFEKGIFKVEWPAIVSYLCDVRHNCKVIGNIHDNPELLKGDESE